VVLERDGRFPDFACLLDQLDLARAALSRGRTRRALVIQADPSGPASLRLTSDGLRDAVALEGFLARLYADPAIRARFLSAPSAAFEAIGLEQSALDRLGVIDLQGFEVAGRSFDAKRRGRK